MNHKEWKQSLDFGPSMLTEEARIHAAYDRRQSNSLYSCFSPGHLFSLHQLERRILVVLKKHGFHDLKKKRVLEIGCGSGYWLREFIKWGADPRNVTGVELLFNHAAEARRLCPEGLRIECTNAAKLTLPNSYFDIVFQGTVFSSVLDSEMRERMASEMRRVVKEDGLIMWYDYHINNPRNPDVRAITKSDINALFPECLIELQRISLAPPIVRRLAPYTWLGCHILESLRCLNTHYLGVIRKCASRTQYP